VSGDPINPELGEVVLNGSEFVPYLKDLSPGEMQGMLTARPGLAEVLLEILSNQSSWGGKAGVTADEFAELEQLNARIARLDVFLRPAQKFAEMLCETRYALEDRRQHVILDIAASVDRRGKHEPELLARYGKTRQYRSASALKGVKTRRRKARQAKALAEAAEPSPVE
jgi:hypothetical protein